MPTVKLELSIGYAGAIRKETEEIDDELWESMNDKERADYLDEVAQEWADNYISISAEIVE